MGIAQRDLVERAQRGDREAFGDLAAASIDQLYNLAQLHFEAGELAAAGRLWQRYLVLDPDSEWSRLARHGLALCRRDGNLAG